MGSVHFYFSKTCFTDCLLTNYPHLNRDQIFAAFEYAADLIANEEVVEIAK